MCRVFGELVMSGGRGETRARLGRMMVTEINGVGLPGVRDEGKPKGDCAACGSWPKVMEPVPSQMQQPQAGLWEVWPLTHGVTLDEVTAKSELLSLGVCMTWLHKGSLGWGCRRDTGVCPQPAEAGVFLGCRYSQ